MTNSFAVEQKLERFGEHIPTDVQAALGALPIRSYTDEDYPLLDEWMKSLATFYDGHTPENKLIDQLVHAEKADPRGFFTKSKALVVSYDEKSREPTGATCFNCKRGGSLKIGPVVVDPELRGRGIGKTLFTAADIYAETAAARKLYATTSHANAPVNKLFERHGFVVEAVFPDQYRHGSQELIWGKFTTGHPQGSDEAGAVPRSVVEQNGHTRVASIESYTENDRDYIAEVNDIYNSWHDDLGEDFIDGMVAGQERGLNFQEKGKVILVAKDSDGTPTGTLTFTPKRGGPVKIYPVAGTAESQTALFGKATEIAREYGNHKLYTFSHVSDVAQQELLTELGFVKRGSLLSAYKDGHNLTAFDMMVE